MSRLAAFLAVAALTAGCGGSSGTSSNSTPTPTPTPTPTATGRVITISGLAFSPLKLQVRPGDTVTVQNKDAMQHTVTSEAAPNAFTHSAVAGISFDTGFFTGTATFTIPASAPVGTVVYYYCRNHTSTMATPTGEIDVVASVSPSPTPTPTPAPPTTGY